jgi:hypothetical protein
LRGPLPRREFAGSYSAVAAHLGGTFRATASA